MHHTLHLPADKYEAAGLLLTTKATHYEKGDVLHITKKDTREQKSFRIAGVSTEGLYKGWSALQLVPIVYAEQSNPKITVNLPGVLHEDGSMDIINTAGDHEDVVEALSGTHGESILQETKG